MYYHIYNRGAHKAPIFVDDSDYTRFMQMMYSNNDTLSKTFGQRKHEEMYIHSRNKIIKIISYVLMPNHFHILAEEISEKGIYKFIHRSCTGYSMYFNNKYNHSGTIIQGTYKIKPVGSIDYFLDLIKYIHLNPFDILRPDIPKGERFNFEKEAINLCKNYKYSSYLDFQGKIRPENNILG